ncbi:hypothetical protein RclHR1_00220032 [Rhizophagus clarus]|nr:hypothetical protein RclHR1_00220032 [Rhizophagus clarus]
MIFYFVMGTNLKNAFEVEGCTGMSISKFKDKIYNMKKNNFKDKGFDSCDLILWKVNIPSDTANIKLNTLQSRSCDIDKENITIKKLRGEELTPFNDFGNIFMSGSKNICIIVQPPPFSDDQELSDITSIIAELGYLPRQSGLGGTLLSYNLSDLESDSNFTNEGVKLNDRGISLRFDIINDLINELIKKKVILVQAPPFAEKTSLAQILEHTLINLPEYSYYRVI